MSSQTKVVVLGSGFGGLHAAFSLRQALPHVDITVVSKSTDFFYRPDSIYIPFGLDPDNLSTPLAETLHKRHIAFIHEAVTRIDPENRTVDVEEIRLPYDFLLVATGSRRASHQVPGLCANGLDVTSVWQLLAMRRAFSQLISDAMVGTSRRVLFLLPPDNNFPGPMFEMALMLDTWLTRQDFRKGVDIQVATWETSFLQAMGPSVHDPLAAAFQKRGITAHTCWKARRVTDRSVMFGDSICDYDTLIYYPARAGALDVPGLTYDENGFLRTVEATRQLEGHPDIFVVGDAAADPGVKQAYVAFDQADVAAAQIVAMVQGVAPTRSYHAHSRYILDTMDAGFLVEGPVETDTPAEGPPHGPPHVGSSRLWHVSKRLLGRYLPWKVRSGEPFSDLLARPADDVDAGFSLKPGWS